MKKEILNNRSNILTTIHNIENNITALTKQLEMYKEIYMHDTQKELYSSIMEQNQGGYWADDIYFTAEHIKQLGLILKTYEEHMINSLEKLPKKV